VAEDDPAQADAGTRLSAATFKAKADRDGAQRSRWSKSQRSDGTGADSLVETGMGAAADGRGAPLRLSSFIAE
jgi:hypothetical protein